MSEERNYKHYPDEVKQFAVIRYACFESQKEIAKAIEEEFGIAGIPDNTLASWNPARTAFALGSNYADLYQLARARFVEQIEEIPIANKAYRLRSLDKMERAAREKNEFGAAASLLKQAAEEVGGVYDKSKAGLTLETLQKEIDKLASAVVKHVSDPEVLNAIEQEWGSVEKKASQKISDTWNL